MAKFIKTAISWVFGAHFHEWSQWSEPEMTIIDEDYDCGSYFNMKQLAQKRKCLKCNKVDIRTCV